MSLSARRAWIEISMLRGEGLILSVALRKESVDRNIKGNPYLQIGRQSLSARRAWIEMLKKVSVIVPSGVALRKESVDRNRLPRSGTVRGMVALRKESVDRNIFPTRSRLTGATSLSARRAWIEMGTLRSSNSAGYVALRKESVDRNCYLDNIEISEAVALRKESVDRNHIRHTTSPRPSMSLSARRAWIEIGSAVLILIL